MTRRSVADMLAHILKPTANADPEGTPAKAANPANLKHWRGFSGDSGPANALRILANPAADPAAAAPDSQRFAGDSQGRNGPNRKQRQGDSQDSQDSQGSPVAGTIGTEPAPARRTSAQVLILPTRPAPHSLGFRRKPPPTEARQAADGLPDDEGGPLHG